MRKSEKKHVAALLEAWMTMFFIMWMKISLETLVLYCFLIGYDFWGLGCTVSFANRSDIDRWLGAD